MVWSKYDPDATGYIKAEDYASYLEDLGEPYGWDENIMKSTRK